MIPGLIGLSPLIVPWVAILSVGYLIVSVLVLKLTVFPLKGWSDRKTRQRRVPQSLHEDLRR